jgi:pyruvate/2-oxoglutarate/acetoin dehydrogenase E1 component
LATDEKYPTAIYRPGSAFTHVTIACYGGMTEVAKDAIETLAEDDIVCEIVSPTQISPMNINPILESVKNSHKLLILEEGPNYAAWGSEVCAALMEEGVQLIKLSRLGNNTAIPCSLEAENSLLISSEDIIKRVKEML